MLDDTISTSHTWAMDKEWKQYKTEFFFPEGFDPPSFSNQASLSLQIVLIVHGFMDGNKI